MTKDPEIVGGEKSGKGSALDSTLINAKVEFTLSKEDLTDMVIDERQEALEDELKKTKTALKKRVAEVAEQHKKAKEQLMALAKKKLAKQVKSVEKLFGAEARFTAVGLGNSSYLILNEQLMIESERYVGTSGPTRRKKMENQKYIGPTTFPKNVQATVYVPKDNMFYVEDTGEATSYSGTWVADVRFAVDELLAIPAVAKLKDMDGERQQMEKKVILLEDEISNLDTLSKRARAKMVRSLLGASDQGKQILKLMPNMDQKLLSA